MGKRKRENEADGDGGGGDDVPERQSDPMQEESKAEEISSFLMRLRNMDFRHYYCRRENFADSPFLSHFYGTVIDMAMATETEARRSILYGEPVQGRNINDVQHFSYSELKQLTNNFSNELFIQKTKFGKLFAAKIQNGSKIQDLVVKTWDFYFPYKVFYTGHPARLHDEITLLMKEETKARKNLVKLIGFCCEEKLAAVYDLKFSKTLSDVIEYDGFTFNARLEVAFKVADLLKWFHDRFIVVGPFDGTSVVVDEEFDVNLVDFEANTSTPEEFSRVLIHHVKLPHDYNPQEAVQGNWGFKSDVYAYGNLLLELITKKETMEFSADEIWMHAESFKKGERSIVNDEFSCTEAVGCKLTKLAMDCVEAEDSSRPDMQSVMLVLEELMGEIGLRK